MLRRMRTPFFLGSCAILAVGSGLALGALTSSCTSTGLTGTTGSGGAGSSTGVGGAGNQQVMPIAGELCTDPAQNPTLLSARVTPSKVFLPVCPGGSTSCTTRTVKLVVDPDTCAKSTVSFTTDNPDVAPAPADASVDLHHDAIPVTLIAGPQTGTATITVTVLVQPTPDDLKTGVKPVPVTTTIDVEVLDAAPPACVGSAAGTVHADDKPLVLGGASIRLQVGADKPDQGSFIWGVQPFPATIVCGADSGLAGYVALGPAITFGPKATRFPREVPLSVPINPALFPSGARLRHVKLAYSGPAFREPRTVPVADVHVTKVNGQWALSFMAPLLGTYQAVVAEGAGSKHFKRRLTHRAVVGISMGGGGTASFGMRHHDLFDVLAPLGGPVDWTWMLDYIEHNHLGGFRPIPSGTTLKDIQLASAACNTGADCKPDETCLGVVAMPATPGKCVLLPKPKEPYAHAQTFNTWWYEYPRSGNGGTFDRQAYGQIFRDLAIMYGNPNADNLTPGGENLPAGVRPDDPSVVGDHPGKQCAIWVDPLACDNGMATCPEMTAQQELDQNCPHERCSHTLTLNNYFDDEYNPDGIFPVITVCDGAPQDKALTPYSNTWHADGNGYPLEVGLAVDYNGNGVRDELEPIIRAGHEPWRDHGVDGIPSSQEAGYSPGVNDDPAGDDFEAQYNPTGTEGDARFEVGEHYDDHGLDGVPGTKQQPVGGWQKAGDGYDVGEGDGKFTVSRGLQRFWDRDAYSIARRLVDPAKVPGGDLDDAALSRLDVWTDGGLRDLFNFSVDAQHLVGGFSARGRDVTYLTAFGLAPGLDPSMPGAYDPKKVDFDDLPGIVLQRYGHIDPSATDIENGSGQHVGTGSEIAGRLESAFYFITQRWRYRQDLLLQVDTSGPQLPGCTEGSSTITYPPDGQPLGQSGRRGPVGISFPPGYCNADLKQLRYPVIFLLHGYGQNPQDLEATIVLLQNLMNNPATSGATRLPKSIIVYVDGRCRMQNGKAECLRGTFFGDSPRAGSAQDESWWLELMNYLDHTYRTLGEATVDWTE